MIATALALGASAAMAGGGIAPPPPGLELIKLPDVKATIVLDPHGSPSCGICGTVTSSGQSGAIILDGKGQREASATFEIPLLGTFGTFNLGCDLTLTDARFLNSNPTKKNPVGSYAPMVGFIPQPTLEVLFKQIGLDINPSGGPALEPAITQVKSQSCSNAVPPDDLVTGPGYLTLDAEIGVWGPTGTKIHIK